MGKFKSSLVKDIEEKKAFAEEQKRIKKEHRIEDENVVVVEKSNMAKFTVKTFIRLVKICAAILIFALATVGAMCLIYPATRMGFFSIFDGTISQMQDLLGIM